MKFCEENEYIKILMTILIGAAGGWIFELTGMPLPWMLGPMASLMIVSKLIHMPLSWPMNLRDWGVIVIGYNSGRALTQNAVKLILKQLPWMFIMTVILIGICSLTAYIFSKSIKTDFFSTLMGCIPGGFSQMILLGEELTGGDPTLITMLQIIRMILVIFATPLIVYSPIFSSMGGANTSAAVSNVIFTLDILPKLLLFGLISIFFVFLAKKIKIPTPYLLGPIIGAALCNIVGFQGPAVPSFLLKIAQFGMGASLGLLLKPENLPNKIKVISMCILNGIILVVISMCLSYILAKTHHISMLTAILCMAPAGADQMSLIASIMSADVSMVTGYQLFRILFISSCVPPVLKWFHKKSGAKNPPNDELHE